MYRMCGYFTYAPLYNEQRVQTVEAFSDTPSSGESVHPWHVISEEITKKSDSCSLFYYENNLIEAFMLELRIQRKEKNFMSLLSKYEVMKQQE